MAPASMRPNSHHELGVPALARMGSSRELESGLGHEEQISSAGPRIRLFRGPLAGQGQFPDGMCLCYFCSFYLFCALCIFCFVRFFLSPHPSPTFAFFVVLVVPSFIVIL